MLDYIILDMDGDGIEDSTAFFTDTDGDGWYDTTEIYSDFDHDGNIEQMTVVDEYGNMTTAVDTDNNGTYDNFVTVTDENLDGIADSVVKSQDYNQDGIVDSTTTYADTTGTGNFDTVIKSYTHTDGSGTENPVFTSEIYHDSTGNGQPDSYTRIDQYDTTGDGVADTQIVRIDSTASGVFDTEMAYEITPEGDLTPLFDGLYYSSSISGTRAEDLTNFDPTTDPEKVAGDPASDMDNWECQGHTNRCAIYSQLFVIEGITGGDVTIDELVEVAEENGWFDESMGPENGSGTTALNMNKLLDYYGIDNDMSFHNDLAGLEEELRNGNKVIVSIDADQIWYGSDPDIFSPASGANHAVQIIGIDYSDPEHPMAILNDSGSPDGCGEMVPLDVFEDAWSAGDNQMIVCYA
ncbi:MAG: C39 family peptidase [Clostridium sp.]|nr:C39 family peptidase [Clostridium sp.]